MVRPSEKLCWIVFMILKIWWQHWKCRQKQKRCSARIQNRVCFIANQQIMMWPARPREIKTRLDSTMIMVMIEFMMIMPNIIHRPSYNIVISNTEENQNKRHDFVFSPTVNECNLWNLIADNDTEGNDSNADGGHLDKDHEGSFLATAFSGSRGFSRNIPWVIQR